MFQLFAWKLLKSSLLWPLQDHIAFSPAYAVNVLTHSRLAVPEVFEEHAALYRENRTGMLTNCGGDILGFAKLPPGSISNGTQADLDAFSTNWPHIEHLFLDAYFGYANSSDSAPNDGRNYVSSSAALTMPFSRGNVTIVSNDTNDYPSISPNWLLDPRDQEMAVAAFKQARLVFTQNVMRPVVIGQEEFPGLNVSSDAEILELIRASAAASYHGSCTCAMGLDSDPMAVLDSRAKVYGVQRLRVVDASAFPVLPPGHPSQTVCESEFTPNDCARGQTGTRSLVTGTYPCLECILISVVDALAEKIANDILVGS